MIFLDVIDLNSARTLFTFTYSLIKTSTIVFSKVLKVIFLPKPAITGVEQLVPYNCVITPPTTTL